MRLFHKHPYPADVECNINTKRRRRNFIFCGKVLMSNYIRVGPRLVLTKFVSRDDTKVTRVTFLLQLIMADQMNNVFA